jgi:hypothetical protein
MEIKGNGKGYPREAVGDLMGLKGNWEGVPQGSLCVSLFVCLRMFVWFFV